MRPDLDLYAVADGAGGIGVGNVASSMGLAALASHLEETLASVVRAPPIDAFGLYSNARRLAIGIQRANQAIITLAQSSKKFRELASTIVALLVDPSLGLLHLGHLGDSRCYRYRAGLVEVLTVDHSLLHDVLEARPDTDDAALAKLPRQIVTRALGMPKVRPDIRSHELLPGDKYLLCSDGVSGALNNQELAEVLGVKQPAKDLVEEVLTLATFPNAEDNATAVIVCAELAPGSSLADRPRPPSTPRPPSSPHDPEILLRTDVSYGAGFDTQFSVLPAGSDADTIIDSGGHAVGLLKTLVSGSDPPRANDRACVSCREPLSPAASFCPQCGTKQPA